MSKEYLIIIPIKRVQAYAVTASSGAGLKTFIIHADSVQQAKAKFLTGHGEPSVNE